MKGVRADKKSTASQESKRREATSEELKDIQQKLKEQKS